MDSQILTTVKTLSEVVGVITSRIASVEQTVNALSAKMAMFAEMEQNFNNFSALVWIENLVSI